jgi:hypothetical protein
LTNKLLLHINRSTEVSTEKNRSRGKPCEQKGVDYLTAQVIVTIAALFISISTLVYTISRNSPRGRVGPLKPSGYAIIRGIERYKFPSDHLVLPFEWENNSGRTVLIRRPVLILRELVDNSEEASLEHRFSLAGEYAAMSEEAFAKPYAFTSSLLLGPHSVSLNILIFHTDDWWNNEGRDYHFRFSAGRNYRVEVEFLKNSEQNPSRVILFEQMPIPEDSANLKRYGEQRGRPWDYYYLD